MLSFSPALGVSAADADNTAYNQLMHNYKVADAYDSFANNDLVVMSSAPTAGIITLGTTAKFENTDGKAVASTFVDLKYSATGNKLVFEADFCYRETLETATIVFDKLIKK